MLRADHTEISLGKLKFGQPHTFKYVLTNSSEKTVIITKLVAGCSACTKAYTSRSYLKPGDSSDINVIFTPGSIGRQSKSIDVVYDNINTVKLKFTAEVD